MSPLYCLSTREHWQVGFPILKCSAQHVSWSQFFTNTNLREPYQDFLNSQISIKVYVRLQPCWPTLCDLLEAVHHLVNASDIQLVSHCLNLILSIGLDGTVRAWSEGDEISRRKNIKRDFKHYEKHCSFSVNCSRSVLPVLLTGFHYQYLQGWYSFCNSCQGDPGRSPPSQVCTETSTPHHLYSNKSTERKTLYTSHFTVSAALSVFIWISFLRCWNKYA